MYIPIILGTKREGRQSEKAANFMLQEVLKLKLESEIIDVKDYVRDGKGENQEELKEKLSKADGFIVVAPEYNHSYPGELKMMLDGFYQEYFRKPIGICGVSSGMLGGSRMVEQLRLVVIALHMVPIREVIYFSQIQDLFDEQNKIKDESYYEKVKKFLEELLWYAKALKEVKPPRPKGRGFSLSLGVNLASKA